MAPKAFLAAFLAPAVLAAINPLTGLNQPTRIIGGEDAELGDFAYVVSLQKNGDHLCTGSLIDARTVLTAAHCLEGFDSSTHAVRAGSLYKSKGGRLIGASSAIAHPDYEAAEISNDVGVVKLSTPLSADDGISFATLARAHFDPKGRTLVTVAGWGLDSENPHDEPPDELQKVDLHIVPRSACRKAYDRIPFVVPDVLANMVCAGEYEGGGWEGDEGTCAGDSGGPLVNKRTGIVVGITSWGLVGCGKDGAPNVFAGVGYLRDFIDEHMETSEHL
ncbi:hypothetical protein G6514_006592 [Epicoccum nigrum]|nr:hypothetical protein G6514_006592 [Epicoccum nigrum]